ncbi:phenylalanine--tRNA ligase subunit alpha [Alicyclobacillus sp.]|uniref:phenylalanine--tRNA ligase subunit alpha n=1 Tax=Alicyclobacillus sp. TaxID=61169 RepID=UPI0025B836CC|nr:phenylalanine--tRNA ligase subunit alpha [Alicyclobacillus sp.]MCL6517802.1 phenylalanine--tRNA ligase subunit alpha [Alicyclobacillus sp.]
METTILDIEREALGALEQVADRAALEEWRVRYLGKKSPLSQVMRQLGSVAAEERPRVGEAVNRCRDRLQTAWETAKEALSERLLNERLASERVDVTLPGRRRERGALHPLVRVMQEVEDIFLGMGFTIAEGPEVETDEYNFEKLNLPKDHPARDMQDTFYLTDALLLRTHTSPMQVRTMEAMRPRVPVKVIVPGRVYRRDEDDATHSHAFNQIEGLVVDEGIRMSDLKGVLEQFARAMFGPDQAVRLRPSFFPFTEPSAEVDVRCINCGGAGCRVCKDTGWIEILGAGMVHPHVLDWAGYDHRRYSGFAFGMGVERIAMLKYGIEDIRHLYQNDLRLLRQFARPV